jgi:chromosome segregation ATPase
MAMSETERNRQINLLKREVQRLDERLRALELDVEPGGHISEGFDRLSREIDEIREELGETNRRLDTMSHQMNTLLARQEVMLEMMTRISDLPEE